MSLLRPQPLLLLAALCLSFALLFVTSSEEGGRVKRGGWPWDWAGKQLCKTTIDCKCADGKSWAKCVKSEGYAASNCCDKNYVWACCGKKPKH
ncbi:hypothetical protein niasHT_025787 [Heterodera trifolii]|uniref:Gland protein n=1 Tax=Heterodera trifolii TaxID=157864 RepID=A0ABD2KDB2_9BILA